MEATLRKEKKSLIVTKDGADYKVRIDHRKHFLALHANSNNNTIDYEKLARGVDIPAAKVYLALHRPSGKYYAILIH